MYTYPSVVGVGYPRVVGAPYVAGAGFARAGHTYHPGFGHAPHQDFHHPGFGYVQPPPMYGAYGGDYAPGSPYPWHPHHHHPHAAYGGGVVGGCVGAPPPPELMPHPAALAHPGFAHPGFAHPGFHPHHHPHHPHYPVPYGAAGVVPADPGGMPITPPPTPEIKSAPWRAMMAPGTPPLGEGHVPLPLTAETYGGSWGNTAGEGSGPVGAPQGSLIIWSGRPQKPFKTARLIVRGTKSGSTAIGNLVGQIFVGTDLQQGELGLFDLESIGAATAFDTWVSMKQAEPGVWIRAQAQLTAYPSGEDFELFTITCMGHYLH